MITLLEYFLLAKRTDLMGTRPGILVIKKFQKTNHVHFSSFQKINQVCCSEGRAGERCNVDELLVTSGMEFHLHHCLNQTSQQE